MKKIRLGATDLAFGLKKTYSIPIGGFVIVGNPGFSFIRIRVSTSQRAIFLLYEFPNRPLVVLHNGHTGLYSANELLDGYICIQSKENGINITNNSTDTGSISVVCY